MKKSIKIVAIALALSFFTSSVYAADLATSATVTTRSIGYAYDGKMITMNVGDEFVLSLGDKYSWSPMVDNTDVLDKVDSITGIAGAQGVFKAVGSGNAMLKAIGKIECKATKKCPVQIFYFKLKIKVKGEKASADNDVTKPSVHTVTSASNNSVIKIKQGDTLRVKLSDNYKWNLSVSGSSLYQIAMPAGEKGYQAYYTASRAGTTVISGTGSPSCFDSTNYCELTTGHFWVRVRVVAE